MKIIKRIELTMELVLFEWICVFRSKNKHVDGTIKASDLVTQNT